VVELVTDHRTQYTLGMSLQLSPTGLQSWEMLQRSDAAATRKYAAATMQLIMIPITASVAIQISILITVAIQISMRPNPRVENSSDWHLARKQDFTGIHMLMAVNESMCMLATLFGYAGIALLAVYGPTDMLAAVFAHAGNMLGAKKLACILATVFGCARNALLAVYGPTCVLATVFGYAGTKLLAVYGPTDMLATVFAHAENMLGAKRLACILATVFGCAANTLLAVYEPKYVLATKIDLNPVIAVVAASTAPNVSSVAFAAPAGANDIGSGWGDFEKPLDMLPAEELEMLKEKDNDSMDEGGQKDQQFETEIDNRDEETG